jgi:SIR2-like domain/Effector-associated domain 1
MTLSNKRKFSLAKLLARLVMNPADIKAICDSVIDNSIAGSPVSFNYSTISLFGGNTPQDLWTKLITAAEDQGILPLLLDEAKKRNPGNDDLVSIYTDVTNGFTDRVKKIATAIKKGDCVLFVGPELLQCLNGTKVEAFNRHFSLELSQRLDKAGVYYDQELNYSLSYIANRFEDIPNVANRELGIEAVKSFSKATVVKNLYDKIADLQFPLIISTNPDDILEQYDVQKGIPYSVDFYDRSNQNRNSTSLDSQKTIIYKIFGSFQSPYSILFTDNDRVQFAKNVVRNDPPIPPVVRVLLENKTLLFLGFNFQEWHLKILIDCLGLAKTEERTFALLMDKSNESSVEHFEKNYKFYFINEDPEAFLKEVNTAKSLLP